MIIEVPSALYIVSFVGAVIALYMGTSLILRHYLNYNEPLLQRHVVRIILLIPVFCITSLVNCGMSGYPSEWTLVCFRLLTDCCEALAIYAFLSLFLEYCGGESSCVNAISIDPGYVSHFFPITLFKSGTPCDAGFVKSCKRQALQFVLIKPLMGIFEVILYLTGHHGLAFTLFEAIVYNISYSVALYALLLFYTAVREHPGLKGRNAFLKLASVKGFVFVTYWQSKFLTFIFEGSPEGYESHITWAFTWHNTLLLIELPFVALVHRYAFPVMEFFPSENMNGVTNRLGNLTPESAHGSFSIVMDNGGRYDRSRSQGGSGPSQKVYGSHSSFEDDLDMVWGFNSATSSSKPNNFSSANLNSTAMFFGDFGGKQNKSRVPISNLNTSLNKSGPYALNNPNMNKIENGFGDPQHSSSPSSSSPVSSLKNKQNINNGILVTSTSMNPPISHSISIPLHSNNQVDRARNISDFKNNSTIHQIPPVASLTPDEGNLPTGFQSLQVNTNLNNPVSNNNKDSDPNISSSSSYVPVVAKQNNNELFNLDPFAPSISPSSPLPTSVSSHSAPVGGAGDSGLSTQNTVAPTPPPAANSSSSIGHASRLLRTVTSSFANSATTRRLLHGLKDSVGMEDVVEDAVHHFNKRYTQHTALPTGVSDDESSSDEDPDLKDALIVPQLGATGGFVAEFDPVRVSKEKKEQEVVVVPGVIFQKGVVNVKKKMIGKKVINLTDINNDNNIINNNSDNVEGTKVDGSFVNLDSTENENKSITQHISSINVNTEQNCEQKGNETSKFTRKGAEGNNNNLGVVSMSSVVNACSENDSNFSSIEGNDLKEIDKENHIQLQESAQKIQIENTTNENK